MAARDARLQLAFMTKGIADMFKALGPILAVPTSLVLSSTCLYAQASYVGSSPDAAAPQAAGENATPRGSGMSSGGYIIEPSSKQINAAAYVGRSVYTGANESIGQIEDIVFDEEDGTVAAVVGVGGFLGLGEKDVAIPNERIEVARDGEDGSVRVTTTETAETLRAAPQLKGSGIVP